MKIQNLTKLPYIDLHKAYNSKKANEIEEKFAISKNDMQEYAEACGLSYTKLLSVALLSTQCAYSQFLKHNRLIASTSLLFILSLKMRNADLLGSYGSYGSYGSCGNYGSHGDYVSNARIEQVRLEYEAASKRMHDLFPTLTDIFNTSQPSDTDCSGSIESIVPVDKLG